jgi:NAD(P)-dependent dehydrogenase (short-subunit alcohol dehydrogenase family)
MYETQGRTALITGAARRIGRATALSLAESGMNIVVHCNTSTRAAEELRGEIRALGVEAWLVQADLAERSEVEALPARVAQIAGTIDVLVNNASVFPQNRITDFTADQFELSLQINALSPLLLARAFAEQTRAGAIVNLLDSRIAGCDPEHATYMLSKRVLLAMTQMLALELAPGIRVSAVAPGLILPPPGRDHSYLETQKHTNPLVAYGSLASVTEAVRFLVSNDFITGQVVYVDGGRHLKGDVYE